MARNKELYLFFVGLVILAFWGSSAFAQCVTPVPNSQVIVWHAGSLGNAFTQIEKDFTCQTGIAVSDHSAGSLDIVR